MKEENEYLPLASLWNRITEEDLAVYRKRFSADAPKLFYYGAMQFGPMDWVEADFFDALDKQIVLLDPDGTRVAAERMDLQSMKNEIEVLLEKMPTNGNLEGYRIGPAEETLRDRLPERIKAAANLWDPGLGVEIGNPFLQDDLYNERFQTLPIFWNRQTYIVDLCVYDHLVSDLSGFGPDRTLISSSFEDHMLGACAAIAEKWRPFEGCILATTKDYADRGWRRNWRSLGQVPQSKGGRPSKQKMVVENYFKLFPNGHDASDASPTGPVSWKTVLNRIIEETGGTVFAMSTLKKAVRKDPR